MARNGWPCAGILELGEGGDDAQPLADPAVQPRNRRKPQPSTGLVQLGPALPEARAHGPVHRAPHAGAKPRLSWLIDDYYEVPYECFVPQRGESLLAAGRCLSAEHEAMASARVTAQCFSYGHAIGHAAAIAVRDNVQPRRIDGAALREVLNRDGAQLGSVAQHA